MQDATGRSRIPFAASRKATDFLLKKVPMRQQYALSVIRKPSVTGVVRRARQYDQSDVCTTLVQMGNFPT